MTFNLIALSMGLSIAVAASYARFSVPAALTIGGLTCLVIAGLIMADVIPV